MPDVFVRPNGLAFSPDEKVLYVVDSGQRSWHFNHLCRINETDTEVAVI